jgi:Tol biopolymer transport system component
VAEPTVGTIRPSQVGGAHRVIPATGCSGVRLVRPDGSEDHAVAQGLPQTGGVCRDGAEAPSFSPDSKRVLYIATNIKTPHKQNGTDLYTVSIHGGAHKRLTRDDLIEASPVSSPNGKSVLFETTGGRGRQNGTFVISASGKRRHRIGPPRDALSWQPLPAG